ncbi:MAG: hypothetical protein AAF495_23240 [Pseudomonadota bacterium]
MVRCLTSLVLLAAALGASPAAAQLSQDEVDLQKYTACMAQTREDPEEAYQSAGRWESFGGGDPAKHCQAVALVALGHYAEGARRLELLAGRIAGSSPELAADVLGQAGQAWLLAEETSRAYAAQTTALALKPDDVELLVDRSITLAGAESYWEAIDDLNRASELAPGRADVLIFRASAYRLVEVPELAMEDITRALVIDPASPEGLLERGILRRLAGDGEGARADWLQVLRLAPTGAAGKSARANLEKLDVTVD